MPLAVPTTDEAFAACGQRLKQRLEQPLPGNAARAPFSPDLSYGRHFGPPAHDARPAAVLLLLYPHEGTWRIPLTVRRADLSTHASQVSFPGGVIEPTETSLQAAVREAQEELGIAPTDLTILGQLSPLYVFISNYWVTPCVAVSRDRPAMHPSAGEVAELIEASLDELADPAQHGRHTIQRGELQFDAPHILAAGKRIWGATALILAELLAIWQST